MILFIFTAIEKNNFHRILAFTLALIVLFPFTVQAVHALDNHEHQICTAKNVKHIHQENLDCSIFHLQIDNNSFDLFTDIEAYFPQLIVHDFDVQERTKYKVNNFSKSSRAPPYFII